MHFVRDALCIGGYRVRLTFDDGSVRLVDLEEHLDGPVFEPLRDTGYFQTLRVEPDLDTIVWDNGADFSPDFLYEIGEVVAESSSAA